MDTNKLQMDSDKKVDNDINNKLESRTDKYDEANDRPTFMSELEKCIKRLEEKGYTDQFRVERKHLQSLTDNKKRYEPQDVSAVNFFRFEGISDPDDMSILYAIETTDGRKGTLVDAYGFYSDDETGEFMQSVDIHKKVSSRWDNEPGK